MNPLLDEAIAFAARAHNGQRRKSDDLPYIAHPFAVALILQHMGCRDEIIIAGLLHDTVEDTDVTLAEIERRFGRAVADIVAGCTEPSKGHSWETRKLYAIEHLRAAPLAVKLVAAADKYHNLSATIRQQRLVGPRVWQRFRRGVEQQAWYYRGVTASLLANVAEPERYPIFASLERLVGESFAGVPSQEPDGNRAHSR
jgi:(p)ppGpp synthase/HD superfamily hydrolase